ncbi:hypothetical protein [Polyangium jinanense]|uniref:Glycosyltransferase RgtA/B/C/D-like domain-containing protein n=1 Tax=Polyangium jinanense TaxID=2829994 RepID=A0A9X3X6W9_9BACT|nr:hypothetical protein [Polyangium jinanense]MDC3985302.1 hypothetical protein [Polyangium jinanense]
MKPRRYAALIVLAAVPLRLALALGTDLSPDEAYYLAAARAPGLLPPLVDHPPLVPLLLRLVDRLTTLPVELRVRLVPLVFSLGLSVATVALARRRGAEASGQNLAAFLSSFALLPVAGGFVATPDGPALLALVLALLWADPAPETAAASLPRRLAVALGLGLVGAAGALAKVVVLPLFPLVVVLAARRRLGERLLALAPLALAAPLLAPSLAFQLRHAYAQQAPSFTLLGALGALAAAALAQVLLWTPWPIFHGARALRASPLADRAVVLLMTALVAGSALARAVPPEPNWYAPSALILVVAFARTGKDLAPRARLAMLLAVLVPTAIAAAHTIHPFLPLPLRADPTARLHGWRTGDGPVDAPGVGPYGAAAERCVYQETCSEINDYFRALNE